MMIAIPTVYTVDIDNAPDPDRDSATVMTALDRDGNGSVDFEEFRDWILSYRNTTRAHRKEFAARSEQHARLNWFAGAVVVLAREEAGHGEGVGILGENVMTSAPPASSFASTSFAKKQPNYNYDNEMEAASQKIQAVHRGRQARREQEERRRATLKIQSLHRGRRARQRHASGRQTSQDSVPTFSSSSSSPSHSYERHTTETLCAGLRLVFDEADLDDNNSIDMDELRALMVELPRRYNVDQDSIPLLQDASVVMSALDADGDGEVDHSEWEDWILSNRALSAADRAHVTSMSEIHSRLDRFVEVIVMIASRKMYRLGGDTLISGLKTVFEEFDTDGDGVINIDELRALMIAIPAVHTEGNQNAPLLRDVGRVMEALDRDASGGIDYAEFRDWIVSNLDQTPEDRAHFRSMSLELRRLDWFARAVASIAKEEAEQEEQKEEYADEDYEDKDYEDKNDEDDAFALDPVS
jgi:Ca2+-binding EF-hand superfamily protein